MRFKLAMLSVALLAGAIPSAIAQAKPPAQPDYATVTRLQGEIAQAEAKGDLQGAALKLRILAGLYKNDPSMRAITYQQLAQVSAQLHDDAKAAEYRALAQGLPPTVSVAPAGTPAAPAAPPAIPQADAVPAAAPDIFAAPVPMPPAATAPAPQTTAAPTSSADKLSKILAEAKQIMAQAKQMQEAMKKKGANSPQPGQPMPPQAGGFPAAPDGVAPAPDPQQAPADAPVAAGVVIGYDANNQPIFAPPPTPPAATPTPPR
jgi:hypothetical protein